MKNNVKLYFLGGIEEIGKNCLAIECGQDIIVVDVGMSFPTEEMLGIDVVIPDLSFLNENASRIKGIVLTHGHEDHIGALPYLLSSLKAPVYGTKLTLMILENKLKEKNVKATLKTVKAGQTVKLGAFSVEFIHVNHSIEGACALAITTPQGIILHTGDFKIDFTPVDGQVTNLDRFAELGRKGVALLMADSTNIEKTGYTMSEKTVGTSLDRLFSENANKRIIVATFASNVHRIQQIIDNSEKYGRKVALSGRSMLNICEAGQKAGVLKIPEGILVEIDKIKKIADSELCIISTGSQGEPMSALTRMANDVFSKVKINKNDTIIISASPIPGNEKMVYRVINSLYKHGAEVIYSRLHDIHVSGHACQEELKIVHSLVKPKYFIPVHGEYRHLKKHKDLAVNSGMKERNVIIPDNGLIVELSNRYMKKVGQFSAGAVLVDGLGFGELDSSLIKDRKHLSEDGILIVNVCISSMSGEILSDVEVIPRGISLTEEKEKILESAKQCVNSILGNHDLKTDKGVKDSKENIKKQLNSFMQRRIKQRPMIVVTIMEVDLY